MPNPGKDFVIPHLAAGEPWNADDMRKALTLLDEQYRANGAAKTVNLKIADDYAILCQLISQAEEAAKHGNSVGLDNFGTVARQYAGRCLQGASIPRDLVERPDEYRETNWRIPDMHAFQHVFCYFIYRRILNPLEDWQSMTSNVAYKQYSNYIASESAVSKTEEDATVAAVKASWDYSAIPPTPETVEYMKEGLGKDLHVLFVCSKGMADCPPELFEETLKRVMTVFPTEKRTDMPLFVYPGEGVKEQTPVTFRAELAKYRTAFTEYDKKVHDLESVIGKADPLYSFDFEAYRKSIADSLAVTRQSPDEYFHDYTEHTMFMEKMVNYVRDNDAIIKAETAPKAAMGEMTGIDYGVEFKAVEQLTKFRAYRGEDLKQVKLAGNRPDATREQVKKSLEYYASLPRKYAQEYAQSVARGVITEPYDEIKAKVDSFTEFGHVDGSMNQAERDAYERQQNLEYSYVEAEIVLDDGKENMPYFEDEVTDPIFSLSKEENILTVKNRKGEEVSIERTLQSSLDTLTKWLKTPKHDLGTYDDGEYGLKRTYTYADRLTRDSGLNTIREVKDALFFLRDFSESAGFENRFRCTIVERGTIEKDLRGLKDLLLARHAVREIPKLTEEIKGLNASDKNAKWNKMSREELEAALESRGAVIERAEKELAAAAGLVGRNVYPQEISSLSDAAKATIQTLKNVLPVISGQIAAIIAKEEKQRRDEEARAEKQRLEEARRAEKQRLEEEAKKKAEEEKAKKVEDEKIEKNPDEGGDVLEDPNIIPGDGRVHSFDMSSDSSDSVLSEDEDNLHIGNEIERNYEAEKNPALDEGFIMDKHGRVGADKAQKSGKAPVEANLPNPNVKKFDSSISFVPEESERRGKLRDTVVGIARALRDEGHWDHKEFDTMKRAFEKYAEVMGRYGFDGYVPDTDKGKIAKYTDDREAQLAGKPEVTEAAANLYNACLAYLEIHLDSSVREGRLKYFDDRVTKSISGQLTPSGRLRKQAALAAANLLTSIPEAVAAVKKRDGGITYVNYRDKIHTRDLPALETTLVHGIGGKPYSALQAKVAEDKAAHRKFEEREAHRVEAEQKKAAPKGPVK